jgi:hypothetical protein
MYFRSNLKVQIYIEKFKNHLNIPLNQAKLVSGNEASIA